jgi:hypothetical protein
MSSRTPTPTSLPGLATEDLWVMSIAHPARPSRIPSIGRHRGVSCGHDEALLERVPTVDCHIHRVERARVCAQCRRMRRLDEFFTTGTGDCRISNRDFSCVVG